MTAGKESLKIIVVAEEGPESRSPRRDQFHFSLMVAVKEPGVMT